MLLQIPGTKSTVLWKNADHLSAALCVTSWECLREDMCVYVHLCVRTSPHHLSLNRSSQWNGIDQKEVRQSYWTDFKGILISQTVTVHPFIFHGPIGPTSSTAGADEQHSKEQNRATLQAGEHIKEMRRCRCETVLRGFILNIGNRGALKVIKLTKMFYRNHFEKNSCAPASQRRKKKTHNNDDKETMRQRKLGGQTWVFLV